MITIERELAKALYMFSNGRITIEQALIKAAEMMPSIDLTNEALSHKGINWIAKQILKVWPD